MDIEAQGPRPVETSADGAEGWEFLKAYSMGFAATVVRFLERIDLVGWFNARVQWWTLRFFATSRLNAVSPSRVNLYSTAIHAIHALAWFQNRK